MENHHVLMEQSTISMVMFNYSLIGKSTINGYVQQCLIGKTTISMVMFSNFEWENQFSMVIFQFGEHVSLSLALDGSLRIQLLGCHRGVAHPRLCAWLESLALLENVGREDGDSL